MPLSSASTAAMPWKPIAGLVVACLLAIGPAAAQTNDTAPATTAEGDGLLAQLATPWTGDLDGMVERGFLRVGVAHGYLFFVADGPEVSGLTVDLMHEFEAHLRESLGEPAQGLLVVPIPLPRDRMLPALEAGVVDLLAANLTVTAERSERVDFAEPLLENVAELLITGPAAAEVGSLDELDQVEIHVRPSSSYHEHLTALDSARRAAGQPGLRLVDADENLEDQDLVELVGIGALQATVVDDHKAALFAQVFEGVTVHDDVVVNDGGRVAWALRPQSPRLLDAVNAFVATARQGTLLGNILLNRYLDDAERIQQAMNDDGRSRFDEVIEIIRTYAERYDFDPLMIAAQGYQESRLDQSARGTTGAVGIMQVLPATALDPAVGIADVDVAERNVEAGVKYLAVLRDTYLGDPAIGAEDRTLMALAAYNAGPGNLEKARERATAMGLDPNVWFGNVELGMATAIGHEPVRYVRNILKYYVTYRVAQTREPVVDEG